MADTRIRNFLFGTLLLGGLAFGGASCGHKESKDRDSEKAKTEVENDTVKTQVKEKDPYGNVALFEATRSKIKFALAFVENYYSYTYWCGEAWTVGHGLTILYNADGTYKKVTSNTKAPTLEESDVFKGRYLTHEILPDIKKCITVPMDENTLIAACVLRYCIGGANFSGSEFVKQLNAGKKGAELAKTLTGWRQQEGVPNRCYFFAAMMAGKMQFSDLLDLRAEGCYNLLWEDIFVYVHGHPKTLSKGFYEWDFSKLQQNIAKAKNPRTATLTIQLKPRKTVKLACQKVQDVVPDYIWQEVSGGEKKTTEKTVAQETETSNTIDFTEADRAKACMDANDESYIAYQNKDYKTALEAGNRALQLAKTNKEQGAANYNVAMAYLAMGEYDQAIKYLETSLAVNQTKDAKTHLEEAKQKYEAQKQNKEQNSRTGRNVGLVALGLFGVGAIGCGIRGYYKQKQK